MKVALIGIAGRVGSRLASELLRRGHLVTGIALHPEKAKSQKGLILELECAPEGGQIGLRD